MPMIAGASIAELPAQLAEIFYTIMLPILLLAGIGWVIQRRLGLDMATLRRLNFYFIMPALVYGALVSSPLAGGDVLTVVAFCLVCLVIQGALTYAIARLRRFPPDMRRAAMMTTMFYNSGNYGLPLQDLAFRGMGLGGAAKIYQTFVMITQNMVSFTVGILIVAGGGGDRRWKQNLRHIARFPPLYALSAALVTILIRQSLGDAAPAVADALAPLWIVVVLVKNAFIAVALLTLGAQLALVGRRTERHPVRMTLVLRLLVGPAIALAVIYTMGLTGLIAQVLLISSATPTAVNCMLLCLEFDNNTDFAARAVFYSTLLSPVTLTLVIFFAQGNLLPGFAL